jgi:gentisate 1,2-dioxygenase
MPTATPEDFEKVRSLDDIYALLDTLNIGNGWAKPEPSLWARPKASFKPAHWAYRPAKAALHAAGRYVNTELAERRNLILINPMQGNNYPTVRTLVAAYQMVKAGETAKSHRHTANALRLVLDTAPGTYTIVDGFKIPMEPGDVLLTPNWCWHAHANESKADAYWMDVLDVPTVHLLNPMFFEHHEEGIEPVKGIAADSPGRFAFADIKARLADAPEIAPGVRQIELGSPAMATVGLHVTRLDAGATHALPAMTSSSIMAAMQGEGTSTIDGETFAWTRGDALAFPAGSEQTLAAKTESYILRATDEPLMSALGWLRPVPKS